MTEPAHSLVLTDEAHLLLGQIVEIIGLTESILARTAGRFDRAAADKIKKSVAGRQAGLWADAIIGLNDDPEMTTLISIAKKEIKDVAEDRNDFVHALFSGDYAIDYVAPGYQATSATRSKNGKTRPVSDLPAIREHVARLSCLIAHIDYCMNESEHRGPSPWLETARSFLDHTK
jgi:hypothetical protein